MKTVRLWRWEYFFIVCTLTLSLSHFAALESSPPGFTTDESAGAAHIICIRETGRDATGNLHPFFAPGLAAGYYTPVYLYFGAIWTAFFGDSISSFRGIAAFFTVMTIMGLFFLARLLMNRVAAVLVAFAASLSPWAFQFSRIAWDPPLMPCFMVWGIFFFLRSQKLRDALLSALLFSLAMYSYPPARVSVPLLIVAMFWFKAAPFKSSKRHILIFLVALILFSVPLEAEIALSQEFRQRFNMLTIFSREFLQSKGEPGPLLLTKVFIHNILTLFDPVFLFFKGDSNLRHSTGLFGIWGWMDILSFFSGAALISFNTFKNKKIPRILLFCVFGYIACIVPAALLWEGLPHALRTIGAWPFLSLSTGVILGEFFVLWPRRAPWLTFLVGGIFAFTFFSVYFRDYPLRSKVWFDTDIVQAAHMAADSGHWESFMGEASYPELSKKYYQMTFGKKICGSP